MNLNIFLTVDNVLWDLITTHNLFDLSKKIEKNLKSWKVVCIHKKDSFNFANDSNQNLILV